jgi:hypothetical protein
LQTFLQQSGKTAAVYFILSTENNGPRRQADSMKEDISMSKFAEVNQKIAETVAEGMKKIENGVVSGFAKVTDKAAETFLSREGESVEEAKARMAQEQADREAAAKAIVDKNRAETEKRVAQAKANVPEIKVLEVKIPEVRINK